MLAALARSLVRSSLAAVLFTAACSSAFADPPLAGPGVPAAYAPAHIALGIAPPRLRAPYDVQILRGDGQLLPTYGRGDRFYVLGNSSERYVIRITNPTARRVEAVVSVDGLDVIDGESGDLHKRGYVVPAYGETRIEGFRTSTDDVATFRFSSVGGSYAGQKGKARNVGVIAVAIFEEQAPPPEQVIVGGGPLPRRHHGPVYPEASRSADAPSARDEAGADRDDDAPRARKAAPAAEPPAPPATASAGRASGAADRYRSDDDEAPAPSQRPGLGTEFGEQRYSSVGYTRFVRAVGRPAAIAELRYNDAAGLLALGIPVQPMPDDDELYTRETANPFPGDHFARPPR